MSIGPLKNRTTGWLHGTRYYLLSCLFIVSIAVASTGQTDTLSTDTALEENSSANQVEDLPAPVIYFEDTIRLFYNEMGPFSAEDRATTMTSKLNGFIEVDAFDSVDLSIVRHELRLDIVHKDVIITSVTNLDAESLQSSKQQIADEVRAKIIDSVYYNKSHSLFNMLKRVGLLVFVIILFLVGIRYLNRLLNWFNQVVIKHFDRYIKGLRIQNYEIISHVRLVKLISLALNLLKKLFIIILVYLSLPVVFSIFPATEGIARTLIDYTLSPLKKFGLAVLGYIPEMVTIVVVVMITRYFVRFLRIISLEVEKGKLIIPNFYPEWAPPTFNLLKILIYIFAFIVIFPYLPGSHSPVFQGVSVFLGLLISLGSSSAISNLIAGLVIIYMRAFKPGDRVKIGDSVGDVIEKTMLVTRLRTIKNEEITIPNSAILNGSTINYSSSAQELGLILNSSVTIGYDVPWRDVYQMLIDAALKTDKIQDTPQPFVLQTELNDFYVTYQINAYTANPGAAARIYSELHGHIQDAFNQAGVEILSPHYRAQRDGAESTIPKTDQKD